MAIADFYYPFDSIDGDRPVTAAMERRFWGALFNDGVVGYDGFALTTISRGVYELGPGVGIVGGMICGIKNGMRLTVPNPTAGATYYVVMRASTYTQARNVAFTAAATTLYNANADQLDESGMRDLVLYRIDVDANGTLTVTDMRTYCTSFDAKQWAQVLNNAIADIESQSTEQLNAMRSLFEAAIDAADAETAGMFGAAGRQGFINPTFTVNQRGKASYGITSGSAYTYDRWKLVQSGKALAGAIMVKTEQDGARHALRIETAEFTGTGNVGRTGIAQNIEGGVRTFCAGRQFTVSFDAKASSLCRLGIDARQIVESGGTATDVSRTVELDEQWRRYSVTFTGEATPTAGKVNDVLQIGFWVTFLGYTRYGADQDGGHIVWLANMQINEGTKALACYARPYADELEACQRYYAALGMVSLAVGAPLAGSNQVITSPLPITRRFYRMPTATTYDRVGVAGRASVEIAGGGWRNGLACSLSSNSVDAPVFVVTNTDVSAVTRVCFDAMALDAEITD